MANIRNFSFQAKGRKESIRKVLDAMEQKTKSLWIDRGAEVHCALDVGFEQKMLDEQHITGGSV